MTPNAESLEEAAAETRAFAPETGDVWRVAAFTVVVTLAAILAIYWQTFLSMVEIWWRSETFAHGFLVMPISAYMIWSRWDTIRRSPPVPNYWVVPLLLLTSAGWFLVHTADVVVLTQLSLVVMLQLAVMSVLGWRSAWAMAFPLAYLWFAVPMGEELQDPLMDFTADFTVMALELTGIPVYREARYLTLPTGNWEVAEACSGIRYLIASLALGCLYAYLTYRALWRRLLFIGLALVVPILANGVRAYSIVLVGHYSGMKLATGIDHIIWGWVFFGIVMLLLFMFGALWREPDEAAEPEEKDHGGRAGVESGGAKAPVILGVGLATVLAAGAGQGLSTALTAVDGEAGDYDLALPGAEGSWRGPLATEDPWSPLFIGATHEARARYAGPNGDVQVRLAHYSVEGQGAELVNSENNVWDREAWRRLSEVERTVSLGPGREFEVHEALLARGEFRRVIWYWYDIGNWRTPEPVLAKLYGALAKVTGADRGGTLVALAADGSEHAAGARRRLESFLSANPAILEQSFISEVGPQR